MHPCKYCNTETSRQFTYEDTDFYVCEDCAHCFLCGKVVNPGEEAFYALPYASIGHDIESLKKANPLVLIGRRDFGIVVHQKCNTCSMCGQKHLPGETTAYITPNRKILMVCVACCGNIEIT